MNQEVLGLNSSLAMKSLGILGQVALILNATPTSKREAIIHYCALVRNATDNVCKMLEYSSAIILNIINIIGPGDCWKGLCLVEPFPDPLQMPELRPVPYIRDQSDIQIWIN